MGPAVIPIILQYALQYGVPAVMEIIKLFQKDAITVADWEAAFAVAQTPYGLTPQLLQSGPVPFPVGQPTDPPKDVPAGVTPEQVIVTIKPDVTPGWKWFCNYKNDCWYVLLSEFTKTALGTGQLWTNAAGLRFYLPADILAGLNA